MAFFSGVSQYATLLHLDRGSYIHIHSQFHSNRSPRNFPSGSIDGEEVKSEVEEAQGINIKSVSLIQLPLK
jgi:hypothetical protein